MRTRVTYHQGGVRFEQHGCILSELPSNPGCTQSVFDVLACAAVVFGKGSQLAMLGFAGGGMLAALRALGGEHSVHGVDLEAEGYEIFCKVAADWKGEVAFDCEDAAVWLQRQRRSFDVIVEDLSMPLDGDVVKPRVAWTVLPRLIQKKLKRSGLAVTNLLPTPGVTWENHIEACRVGPGVVVEFEYFFNRVLIQGRTVPNARRAGRELRAALRSLGSGLAEEMRVRSLPEL